MTRSLYGLPALVIVAASMPVVACGDTAGPPIQSAAAELGPQRITPFTVRLAASDAETQAIVLTQTVYPATREENAPGAIILSPQDPALAFTAMHRITHMPVNAPILYLDREGRLSERVKSEMRRLRPEGVMQDGQIQVYIVGEIDPSVATTVRDELRYQVREFRTNDPIYLTEWLDRWQAALKSDHPDEVVISALSDSGLLHGLGPLGFNAHMGKGFGWVFRDSIPPETRRILGRRLGGAYIYISGGEDIVSADVARELARYGPVRRIRGPTVYATAAVNAGYKDFGRNWGWWWAATPRDWGWGIAQAGHNFIIGSPDDPLGMIAAVLLGHMGKHGPVLLVARDSVPRATRDYLTMVKPDVATPNETILNFAWIIGGEARVSWPIQQELTRLLAPANRVANRPTTGPATSGDTSLGRANSTGVRGAERRAR